MELSEITNVSDYDNFSVNYHSCTHNVGLQDKNVRKVPTISDYNIWLLCKLNFWQIFGNCQRLSILTTNFVVTTTANCKANTLHQIVDLIWLKRFNYKWIAFRNLWIDFYFNDLEHVKCSYPPCLEQIMSKMVWNNRIGTNSACRNFCCFKKTFSNNNSNADDDISLRGICQRTTPYVKHKLINRLLDDQDYTKNSCIGNVLRIIAKMSVALYEKSMGRNSHNGKSRKRGRKSHYSSSRSDHNRHQSPYYHSRRSRNSKSYGAKNNRITAGSCNSGASSSSHDQHGSQNRLAKHLNHRLKSRHGTNNIQSSHYENRRRSHHNDVKNRRHRTCLTVVSNESDAIYNSDQSNCCDANSSPKYTDRDNILHRRRNGAKQAENTTAHSKVHNSSTHRSRNLDARNEDEIVQDDSSADAVESYGHKEILKNHSSHHRMHKNNVHDENTGKKARNIGKDYDNCDIPDNGFKNRTRRIHGTNNTLDNWPHKNINRCGDSIQFHQAPSKYLKSGDVETVDRDSIYYDDNCVADIICDGMRGNLSDSRKIDGKHGDSTIRSGDCKVNASRYDCRHDVNNVRFDVCNDNIGSNHIHNGVGGIRETNRQQINYRPNIRRAEHDSKGNYNADFVRNPGFCESDNYFRKPNTAGDNYYAEPCDTSCQKQSCYNGAYDANLRNGYSTQFNGYDVNYRSENVGPNNMHCPYENYDNSTFRPTNNDYNTGRNSYGYPDIRDRANFNTGGRVQNNGYGCASDVSENRQGAFDGHRKYFHDRRQIQDNFDISTPHHHHHRYVNPCHEPHNIADKYFEKGVYNHNDYNVHHGSARTKNNLRKRDDHKVYDNVEENIPRDGNNRTVNSKTKTGALTCDSNGGGFKKDLNGYKPQQDYDMDDDTSISREVIEAAWENAIKLPANSGTNDIKINLDGNVNDTGVTGNTKTRVVNLNELNGKGLNIKEGDDCDIIIKL